VSIIETLRLRRPFAADCARRRHTRVAHRRVARPACLGQLELGRALHPRSARARPLEGRYPYPFVDAKTEKVRDGGVSRVSASSS